MDKDEFIKKWNSLKCESKEVLFGDSNKPFLYYTNKYVIIGNSVKIYSDYLGELTTLNLSDVIDIEYGI